MTLSPRYFSSWTLALGLALLAAPLAYAADDKDDKDAKDVPADDGAQPPPDDPGAKGDKDGPERIRPFPGPGGLPMPPGGPRPLTGGAPNMPPPTAKSTSAPAGPTVSGGEEIAPGAGSNVTTKKVPCVEPKSKITMDYVDAPLGDVVKYMAQVTCRNFILSDDLKGQVTIISHQQVTVSEAYEAFLSALEVAGYTTVTVGKNTKVVSTTEAGNAPVKIYEGDDIPATDNFVTQIVNLENVNVSDISSVVKELAGPKARIIAYAPTNTLIITDAAYNIRRVYRIVMELDVAAPKSRLEVIPIRYATASDVERILAEVFSLPSATGGGGGTGGAKADAGRAGGRRKKDEANATAASATNVGSEGSYISKIISDERTNSLIVMANDDAIKEIRDLLGRIDVDIDPASRSQIHVIYLENAKATDISSVLTDLSGSGSGGGSRSGGSSKSGGASRSGGAGGKSNSGFGGGGGGGGFGGGGFGGGGGGFGGKGPNGPLPGGAGPEGPGGSTSAVAAFDNGVRITADENTNSLVIIAAPEDYRVLKGVIDRLDIMRRQVFVEAVVLEVGSEDSLNLGIGYHAGSPNDDGSIMYGAGGLGASTLGGIAGAAGLATGEALSGLAMGIFGENIEVPITGPDGSTTTVGIPGFGIALNALAANSAVDILSNPSLLILDNEEAKINVGRNVPFPVSSGRDNNGQPIVSFQREDVGITLKVTPQINEANFVTLDLSLEVAEVEESSGGDTASGGFITSKRDTENVVVVKDNQTIVIGGLIGTTQTEAKTKIPILGDIPLIGVLFRGKTNTARKTNLLIFLTPHVINEPADLEEVYRIKWAQREEFMHRFYGKSRDDQQKELQSLLTSSMNIIDAPSVYSYKKPPVDVSSTIDKDGVTTNDALVRPVVDPSAPEPAPETTPEPAPAPAPVP